MDRVAEALDIVRRAYELGGYDSNVIGMAAEIIAEEVYGMHKAPRGTRAIDGTWAIDGQNHTVQVKAWSEARILTYRRGTFLRLPVEHGPDRLLLLLVRTSKNGYEELYNGPAASCGRIERNGRTRVVRLDSVKSMPEIERLLGEE